jgi:hypothetical protein
MRSSTQSNQALIALAGAALLVLLVGAAFLIWPAVKPDAATALPTQQTAPRAVSVPPVTVAPSGAGLVETSVPTGPVQRKISNAALYTAPNVAKFVIEARQRPAEGGVYVAFYAMKRCGEARHLLAELPQGSVMTAQQSRAKAMIESRCDSLHQLYTWTDEGEKAFLSFEQDWGRGLDPFVNASYKLLQASHDERVAALKLLLPDGGAALIPAAFPRQIGPLHVNGQLYGGSIVGFSLAWDAYKMEQSLAADPVDGGLLGLMHCARGYACEGSALDRSLSSLEGNPKWRKAEQEARRIYPELKRLLDTADVDALLPKKP